MRAYQGRPMKDAVRRAKASEKTAAKSGQINRAGSSKVSVLSVRPLFWGENLALGGSHTKFIVLAILAQILLL